MHKANGTCDSPWSRIGWSTIEEGVGEDVGEFMSSVRVSGLSVREAAR